MRKNKKILSIMLCGAMIAGALPATVSADQVSSSGQGIALGADLTDEQKQTVYGELGVDASALGQYTTVTVTNAEEHQYLDNYVSSDLIGTKSYS